MLQRDNETNNSLLMVRIVYVAMLLALIIYAEILYAFVPGKDIQIFAPGAPELTIIEVILAVVSVITITLGYFGLKLIRRFTRKGYGYVAIYLARVALFQSVGVYGLMLGIMGAGWQISLPFLFVSAVALILTFPTKERWEKTLEKLGPINEERGIRGVR